jgi:uncharacterized protein
MPVKSPPAAVRIPSWEELRPEVTDDLLRDMTQRIVDAFHPDKIVLFGSYAYGGPTLDSDVDLLVIMESEERPVVRSRRVREVASVDFLPMDVMVRTPAEIANRLELGDFFIKEILDHGRVLYEHVSA